MKKIIFIFLLLIIPNTVKAIDTFDRSALDNYGVNKNIVINENNINNILSTYKVDESLKIYDFSNVLTAEEEMWLKEEIDKFINKYNTELIILIDEVPYYYDEKNEEYAVDFYDYNDFGLHFKDYDGIILFRNTYEQDPYFDMYTFGKAQLYFNQNRYDDILDSIYYDLKNKNHYEGFDYFIYKINYYYQLGKPSSMDGFIIDEDGYLQEVYVIPWKKCITLSLVITAIIIFILVKKNKMIEKSVHANEYLDRSSINFTSRINNFITSYTRSYTTSSSSGSSGGGSRSRSGSSGRGHSRGGGRHG